MMGGNGREAGQGEIIKGRKPPSKFSRYFTVLWFAAKAAARNFKIVI